LRQGRKSLDAARGGQKGDAMDGMQHVLRPTETTSFAGAAQSTFKASIDCVGIGLHSGRRVRMVLRPAAPYHGIVFRRADLGRDIPARFDLVADTRLATVLADPGDPSVRVGTIEHVMAALAGCGIDNALIEVDGPELPALDGSAAHLVFLIDCAGIEAQDAPRRTIEVVRTVRVSDGDAFAELSPAPRAHSGAPAAAHAGLHLTMSIAFDAPAIGQQALSLRLTPKSFRQELSRARTFALAEDIDRLRAAGMARGGSLDTAVVVDAARVLNPGGLRMHDEFVRHKLLDAVGDLALAGAPLSASFTAHRSGHGLNNRLLRALLGNAAAWRMVTPTVTDVPVPVAA
jgi:UDP-3-O-[3-hydroxymyristoyl] N-acetylglucosamine deacetylase